MNIAPTDADGRYSDVKRGLAGSSRELKNLMGLLQGCAEKSDCFAKHRPGKAGWGRTFLAAWRLAPTLLHNPV